jgi:hypothetical protein
LNKRISGGVVLLEDALTNVLVADAVGVTARRD